MCIASDAADSSQGEPRVPRGASPPSSKTETLAPVRLTKLRHDLRTPINHIIGYSEILLEDAGGSAPPAFIADLERIRNGGQQLLALINHHLSEERFAGGAPNLQQLSHDLRTPVNHIIGYADLLAEQASGPGHEDFGRDLRRIVEAARKWLEVMERELMTPAPGAPQPAEVSASDSALIRRFQSAPPTAETAPDAARSRSRILVADDDPGNRELLRRRLERLGYDVTECADGHAAWKLVGDDTFDLLLLDMMMPGLDGHQLLERLKAEPRLRHLPVIMISALDQMEGIVRCIELGAEDYLPKPFSPVLLRARVGAALEKKRLRDAEQVYLRQIEEERAAADRLLLNVLPRPIADRLKQGETGIVDSFSEVTVLFADIVGFTRLSLELPPARVVRLLDEVFTAFDDLASQHGLEKIKTIGDAYMAVSGLPFPRADHAPAAARMALAMRAALEQFNARHGTGLQMRIGLNSGPVIAGIIGRSKFIYDLWGDTVNTASRMESHGEPGQIQISETTAAGLNAAFQLQPRGLVSLKGRGELRTFWLEGEIAGNSGG
jgi:class 3 adenylate cyclase